MNTLLKILSVFNSFPFFDIQQTNTRKIAQLIIIIIIIIIINIFDQM
jgi:hypothetical protein